MIFKKILIHFISHFTALFRYINMAHDVDLAPSQLWFCTAIVTILFTSSMCSTFFILSMTFERCYSIIRPHKAASFNTVRRAKITIICIIIFSIVYNLPSWFVTAQDGQSRNCVPYGYAMNSLHGQVYYWTCNILNFILPFIHLLIMNTVIINTLSKRSKQITSTTGHGQSQGQGQMDDHSQKSKNSETQISVTLLLVTFSYLILNSPTYVYIFLVVAEVKKQTAFDIALFHLIFSVGQKALYTNYGINFFLYVISGEKFRTNLLSLLRSIFCHKAQ